MHFWYHRSDLIPAMRSSPSHPKPLLFGLDTFLRLLKIYVLNLSESLSPLEIWGLDLDLVILPNLRRYLQLAVKTDARPVVVSPTIISG